MNLSEITNASHRRLADQARIAHLHLQAAQSEVAFALQQLDAVGMSVKVTDGEILQFDFTLPAEKNA